VPPALLNKSKITHFGNIHFTNPDRLSLAQSSYNPEDFGSRKGAGHAVFSARVSPDKAFASAVSELKSYKSKFNLGGVIDANDLSCALEAALDAGAEATPDGVCTMAVCLPEEQSGRRRNPARDKTRARNDGLVADIEDVCVTCTGSLLSSNTLWFLPVGRLIMSTHCCGL
jgi:hypothetical protein